MLFWQGLIVVEPIEPTKLENEDINRGQDLMTKGNKLHLKAYDADQLSQLSILP
jgi:hypothetical protein